MFREKFGADWASALNHADFWQKMTDPAFVSDEELWALRYKVRRELVEFARRRLLLQSQRVSPGDYIRFDHLLNPDALTIGFARRFATYKRAPLIFQQFENILKLVHDTKRPIQFIFAGKAHPRDNDGKRFIQQIIHLSKHSDLAGYLVFIENYDIHVARQMVAGCDIWLNNPRRPLEASGTSSMKASCHGCLGFSILDGWWREGLRRSERFWLSAAIPSPPVSRSRTGWIARTFTKLSRKRSFPCSSIVTPRASRANGSSAFATAWPRWFPVIPPTGW